MKCKDCEFSINNFDCKKDAKIKNGTNGYECNYKEIKRNKHKSRFDEFSNLVDLNLVRYVNVYYKEYNDFPDEIKIHIHLGSDEFTFTYEDFDKAYREISDFYKALKERGLYKWR